MFLCMTGKNFWSAADRGKRLCRKGFLAAMSRLREHVALRMSDATSQRRARKFFSDDSVKTFDAVSHHQAYSL